MQCMMSIELGERDQVWRMTPFSQRLECFSFVNEITKR